MKCQRRFWPCALHPSSRFQQTPCPQAQALLHGPREQALTFEDRDFFSIYLFSRRRENRASASIDFSYVCSESVAKFWEFHIFWLPLKTAPQICFFFQCRGVLLSVLLLKNHNMYFRSVFCTKSHYCPPLPAIWKQQFFHFVSSVWSFCSAFTIALKPTMLLLCTAFVWVTQQ